MPQMEASQRMTCDDKCTDPSYFADPEQKLAAE